MSKILITSDIHFDSYPSRTPTKDYRLNQSHQVIENLLEISRKEGTEYVFILGDILEKQNRESLVHSVVKDCLAKLMTGFTKGYYILGNHDISARNVSSESTENDKVNSYIHLYCPENLIYMDRKIVDIDGVSFGFRNYSSASKLDLSFIKESGRGSIDVLCGHSSQSYVDGEPPYPVQEYDESLVSLYGIFGHIHQSVWKGNKVSVGVPQRAKITDDYPKVVIFDTLTKSWKFVDADPAGKLMDFKKTTTGTSDYFDSTQNIYYILDKKTQENEKLLKSISETNYDKIFEGEIKKRGLSEIFNVIKNATPQEALEKLDLDFKILELRVTNWRTIKSEIFNFGKGTQYLVSGQNGAGKSSLYSSLVYGLTGKCSGLLKDNVRFGETEASVEVDLEYKGSPYTIKRGTSVLELWKDGAQLEFGNKNQTKEGILSELPFLEAMDLMYYNENNQRILGNSSSSDAAKLQILYKILGLNEIDAYNSVASELYKKLSKDFSKKHEEYIISEASLKEKKGYLDSLEFKFGGSTFDVNQKIQELTKTLEGLQNLYTEKQKYDAALQENQQLLSEISGTELLIKTLQDRIKTLTPWDEIQRSKTKHTEDLKKTQESLGNLLVSQAEYSKLSGSKEFIVKEGLRINQELAVLEEEIKSPTICSVYGISCSQVTPEMKENQVKERKIRLEEDRDKKRQEYRDITKKLSEISFSPEEIQRLTHEVSEIKSKISGADQVISEHTRLSQEISQKTSYLDSLRIKSTKGLPKPVELPVDILTRIQSLSSEISTLSSYQRLSSEYKICEEKFLEIKKTYSEAKTTLDKYNEFIGLTKPSGVVYEKIFEIIMSSFSDDQIRYEVSITKRGENRYINIISYLKRPTGDVSYSGASQGEKCRMDIHFLSNLNTNFGLLVFDEFLGNLDQENHDVSLSKIQSLKSNLLFVTSHRDNLMPFPNRIEVSMVGGESKYQVE